ncbi:MAG: SagB/ThcOx family dehydrogenase [Euryarchaeota archaeon]|nr:SagB/ThcOx family dehydrogenase [Euryarchaeota archaeon]MBU4607629.1 SagB/ThcOx family dehydrogenase [Euryarchaeota archaeon]MBV1754204.1 SagB/ThcOx family dehydrogenase [Methanobacterium sp.]MBV1767064.1 SagB/ThcOx family dehydrogenase [Methanobacterium sp.]
MNKKIILIICAIILGSAAILAYQSGSSNNDTTTRIILGNQNLPEPVLEGNISLEETINNRRSVRNFKRESLSLNEVSQILWAAQGITDVENNLRAAPSAGATYPLELYILVGENGVDGLEAGLYHYIPESHSLEKMVEGDLRQKLYQSCNNQESVRNAPASIIITAFVQRTQDRYLDPDISAKYVHMEAGHAGQNIFLQSTALGLGTVSVGAINQALMRDLLKSGQDEEALYVFPVGYPLN